ncbi:MAG: hypothetical protein Q9208_003610 [Pyrenodesmia sp. 3 TL-2023]
MSILSGASYDINPSAATCGRGTAATSQSRTSSTDLLISRTTLGLAADESALLAQARAIAEEDGASDEQMIDIRVWRPPEGPEGYDRLKQIEERVKEATPSHSIVSSFAPLIPRSWKDQLTERNTVYATTSATDGRPALVQCKTHVADFFVWVDLSEDATELAMAIYTKLYKVPGGLPEFYTFAPWLRLQKADGALQSISWRIERTTLDEGTPYAEGEKAGT